jgi:hypothetical protein
MVVRGEKLGGKPTNHSGGVLGIVSRALFLMSSRVHPTLLGQREILPHTGATARSIGVEYVDQRKKHTCHMY